ncbi:MAG TPA: universal stress protein [Ktedonobacterales bacterium]|jgi:nucleotide-binding universal stress UspA family protein
MISQVPSTNQVPFKTAGGLPPYGRILVPLDGSPLAEEALPTAIAFAQRAGPNGKLILLRVSKVEYLVYSRGGPFEVPAGVHEEVDASLIRMEQAIKAQGVPVEAVRTGGDPAIAIVDMAHDHHADLIVMVTHAREGMNRLIHGSVADQVLQGAPVPVLLLKHGEEPAAIFTKAAQPHLIVPLDGSELAESVLMRAISLANQLGGSVTLLRSLDLPDLTVGAPGRAAAANDAVRAIAPTERQTATRYLETVQQRFQAQGIPAAVAVTEGGAALDIAEQARTLMESGQAVIIVMATHGRTGVGRWLYGSVTGAVLHLADVPLLVIRPR